MAGAVDAVLTTTDRQRPIRATLRNADGPLATLTDVTFRMVHEDGTVKVDDNAAIIDGPGVVYYEWQAEDVDTPGVYFIWFQDTDASGRPQHWPDGGRTYAIKWVGAE